MALDPDDLKRRIQDKLAEQGDPPTDYLKAIGEGIAEWLAETATVTVTGVASGSDSASGTIE